MTSVMSSRSLLSGIERASRAAAIVLTGGRGGRAETIDACNDRKTDSRTYRAADRQERRAATAAAGTATLSAVARGRIRQ
jgi:hypothetical protein